MRGFTLIELLIVIGISTVLAGFVVPTGITFYQTQILDDASSSILGTLRSARSEAVFQKNDRPFGVKFLSGSYVLFQGPSYAARVASEDESFELPLGVSATGIDEILFTKLTGTTTSAALTVKLGGAKRIISINSQGNVEKQ